jgi:hypothetical protein
MSPLTRRISLFAGMVLAVLCIAVLSQFIHPMTPQIYLLRTQVLGEAVGPALSQESPGLETTRGADFAVSAVVDATKQGLISSDECHDLLHILGHQAFRQYGTDFTAMLVANPGINTCNGGFIHGIEAEILLSGDNVKQTLWGFCSAEKAAQQNDGPCFHGVGHAAFELYENVPRALAVCDELAGGPEPDLTNCYRGVFSQLDSDLAGVDANSGVAIRPMTFSFVSAKNPYALCDELALKYKNSCYSQLAQRYDRGQGLADMIDSCSHASKNSDAVIICISINASVEARTLLDTAPISSLAAMMDTFPENYMPTIMEGVYEGYLADVPTNANIGRWAALCPLLSNAAERNECAKIPGSPIPADDGY